MQDIQQNAKKASELLKAISHESRLVILCMLSQQEMSAGELQQYTELSQSAFSQHLKVLRDKEIVKTRKEAQTIYYSIKNKSVLKILQSLYEIYCK